MDEQHQGREDHRQSLPHGKDQVLAGAEEEQHGQKVQSGDEQQAGLAAQARQDEKPRHQRPADGSQRVGGVNLSRAPADVLRAARNDFDQDGKAHAQKQRGHQHETDRIHEIPEKRGGRVFQVVAVPRRRQDGLDAVNGKDHVQPHPRLQGEEHGTQVGRSPGKDRDHQQAAQHDAQQEHRQHHAEGIHRAGDAEHQKPGPEHFVGQRREPANETHAHPELLIAVELQRRPPDFGEPEREPRTSRGVLVDADGADADEQVDQRGGQHGFQHPQDADQQEPRQKAAERGAQGVDAVQKSHLGAQFCVIGDVILADDR